MPKILCIDDDAGLTDLLRYGLAREGFEVATAATGREGLRLARAERFDLVILDVNLPDLNGFKVLAALRASSSIPVVMLTAHAQDEDVIAGFGGGADDYVPKPFSMQVLAAHVKAVLRRAGAPAMPVASAAGGADGPTYRVAGATLDPETNELRAADGARVRLTPTEGDILRALLVHEGRALTPRHLLERIRGYTGESDVNAVKTHVHHLRRKLLQLPGAPRPIRTLPGVGYALVAHGPGDGGVPATADDGTA